MGEPWTDWLNAEQALKTNEPVGVKWIPKQKENGSQHTPDEMESFLSANFQMVTRCLWIEAEKR